MVNNPLNTFIEVEVGGYKLHSSQDIIMDLQVHTEAGATLPKSLHINFYDDTALLLETLLISSIKEIKKAKIRYGYVDGECSPVHTVTFTNFSSEFTARGMSLSCEASFTLGEDKTSSVKSYSGSISDIVKQVVADHNAKAKSKDEKWELVRCVPTEPVLDKDGTQKVFRCENLNDKVFIEKVLIPEATASGLNLGRYEFREDVSTVPHKFYFQPVDYPTRIEADVDEKLDDLTPEQEKILDKIEADQEREKTNNISMVYYIGKPSDKVIAFRPEYDFKKIVWSGSGVTVSATDPHTGESLSYDVMDKEVNGKPIVFDSNGKVEEEHITFCGGSKSLSEIKSIARNVYYATKGSAITATLELVGSPLINPSKNIEIVVITPSNAIHFTSGKYLIKSVDHNIGLGSFTTTLSLEKMGANFSYKESASKNGSPTNIDYKEPDLKNYKGQEIAIMKFSRNAQRLYCYTKDEPTKEIMSFECRDAFVDGTNSEGLPYASLPNGSHQVVSAEEKSYGREYGTFYIDVGDPRGRAIHGGGSSCADPYADRHEWVPTYGCLRMQNGDGKTLVRAINSQSAKPWLFVVDSL